MDMMPLIPNKDENENPNAQEEQKKILTIVLIGLAMFK
jgi:hypothetical protein